MPSTPRAECTDLGRRRFLSHGGRLRQPTSFLDPQTPGSPPTPSPTLDWTCDSPDSFKTYGVEDLLVKWGKAIPLGIVHSIVSFSASSSDQKTQHTSDLVILEFYFCL